MNVISNILYWISTGLLVPVIVLLIFFFIRALIMIGAFFGQYLQFRKYSGRIYCEIEKNRPVSVADIGAMLPEKPHSAMDLYARRLIGGDGDRAAADLILSEFEIASDKNIAVSRMLTKMGPILGLMGTLIPMGPALVGLSTGDIASMAYNMQVAFATTVVGLVVSAVGFITQQVRERWNDKEYAILDYIVSLSEQEKGGSR